MTITVLAHNFTVGDVDDPDIYAAQPIYEWQQSEAGQWMMKHSDPTPSWHQAGILRMSYGTSYQIRGYLTPQLYTFWKLKYE
jgi:hypothetical protein